MVEGTKAQTNQNWQIARIKRAVRAMLHERDAVGAHPSETWIEGCSHFRYLIALPDRFFRDLRFHTYHLTGDTYLIYWLPTARPEQYFAVSARLTRGLPSALILDEPDGEVRGIGFKREGRFISADILRFQDVIRTLYLHGVMPRDSSNVLEIGGGYGGLAHHLSKICRNITYVLVDLPECLLFSAAYLSLLNPEKRLYLYERDTFPKLDLSKFDFVLLPNYQLSSLKKHQFDLALNTSSFQEMTTRQVEDYLDFIQATCSRLYSWNQDKYIYNCELSNLTDLLRQRFRVVEVLDERQPQSAKTRFWTNARRFAIRARLIDHRPTLPLNLPYHRYICSASGTDRF